MMDTEKALNHWIQRPCYERIIHRKRKSVKKMILLYNEKYI